MSVRAWRGGLCPCAGHLASKGWLRVCEAAFDACFIIHMVYVHLYNRMLLVLGYACVREALCIYVCMLT